MSDEKMLTTRAYAIAIRRHGEPDLIDVVRIESFTDEGRRELVRQINRPAGERVVPVRISSVRKKRHR